MEERDGDDDLVDLGVMKALGEELAIVDDVVMGEHDTLGQAGGTAGVLDVGDVLGIDVVGQAALGVEEGGPLGGVEVDDVLELMIKAVTGAGEDVLIVGVLVLVPEEEGFQARALKGVLQLVGAVGWVDVDQRGSGTGDAHVHHRPFNTIGGPDADAVAAPYAQRPKAAGDAVGFGGEFGPGEALLLVAGGHGEAVGIAAGGAVEQAADGQIKERAAGAARVALGVQVFFDRHGFCFELDGSVYQPT